MVYEQNFKTSKLDLLNRKNEIARSAYLGQTVTVQVSVTVQ